MKYFVLFISILTLFSVNSQVNHSKWDALLTAHVSKSGIVDYNGFKADQSKLTAYLNELAANAPSSSWSENETMAYWINAYNAYTVKLMIKNYPLSSITNLKYEGKSAWDYKWIKIGAETLSLNDIEHTKLRKKYNDPRIHFAVNCASFSCPILLNTAYTSDKLMAQLESQARLFINDPKRNQISSSNVKISQIFEWYKDDFTRGSKGVIDYLNKYSKTKIKPGTKISYLNYNWKLNE
ncbi:MAG: DUF547 domain-containing protein [Crocinitomicaceae bacterium]|nr:DUF547 domain-containing protein [Crocinitomicaceae bacterium]